MKDRDSASTPDLDAAQRASIEAAVKEVAWRHLKSENAEAALSCYEPDAMVASDGVLYSSFDQFAQSIRDFYSTLERVELAVWEGMHVQPIAEDAAVLTATFRWASTDTEGVRLDLKGVWTAVYMRRAGAWKIRARHESFERQQNQE